MCIGYNRTIVETYTYLSLCLPSWSRSNIDPILFHLRYIPWLLLIFFQPSSFPIFLPLSFLFFFTPSLSASLYISFCMGLTSRRCYYRRVSSLLCMVHTGTYVLSLSTVPLFTSGSYSYTNKYKILQEVSVD